MASRLDLDTREAGAGQRERNIGKGRAQESREVGRRDTHTEYIQNSGVIRSS